jgi:CrcB protein
MRSELLRRELNDLALVAGGAIPGALLRWRLSLELPDGQGPLLPWLDGTLLANLCGCLLIGLLAAQPPRRARLFLWGGIGFSGSLTTFSTWMLQLTRALHAGRFSELAASLLIPLAGGLALTALGYRLGSRRGNPSGSQRPGS